LAGVVLDEVIPAELYMAVAEVFGFVLRLRKGRPPIAMAQR
jgi:type III secretion system FlhB-like substrate exporter